MTQANKKQPYNIMYIENGAGFGGAVTSLRSFLENRHKEKYTAFFIHSFQNDNFSTFKHIAETYYLPYRYFLTNKKGIKGSLTDIFLVILPYALSIFKLIVKKNIHLIHLNNGITCNIAGVIASKMAKRPVIIHERDIPTVDSRLAIGLIRWVDKYFAISEACKNALLTLNIPSDKIIMIPEGLDSRKFSRADKDEIESLRCSLDVCNGHLIIMVGMITEWKGQHILVKAAREIVKNYPNAKILFVGEAPENSDSYLKFLFEMVQSLNLSDNIKFSGYRTDIPQLMQAADVIVHASIKGEPFGRVIIEGMYMGTPVIATNIGAPPEIIEHRKTGFLISPDNPKQLSEIIVEILDHPEIIESITQKARNVVKSKYLIEHHVEVIESVYEHLL